MKLIERFKPRRVFPKKGESRFHEWEEWKDVDGSAGLSTDDLMSLLEEWGYSRLWSDTRIWKLVDMVGASEYRIVDDTFDVDSYNVALKE